MDDSYHQAMQKVANCISLLREAVEQYEDMYSDDESIAQYLAQAEIVARRNAVGGTTIKSKSSLAVVQPKLEHDNLDE